MNEPTTQAIDHGSNWWSLFYDDLLAEMLLVRNDQSEVDATIKYLDEHLRLKPGDRVFDQCCGIGSLSIPLALQGMSVVGVDQASPYIERARTAARDAGVNACFEVADAFEFVPEACAGAFNWWTSYGYAATESENRRMLKCAFESLVAGGRFVLDVPHLPGVLRHFQPEVALVKDIARGEVTMTRTTRLDLAGGRMLKCWDYTLGGELLRSHKTSIQLTMPHELVRALESVGFEAVSLHGGVDGRDLSINDKRCILIAERPLAPV